MIPNLIYKIFTHDEWKNFKKKKKSFNILDIKSGFVHLSTQETMLETANLFQIQL